MAIHFCCPVSRLVGKCCLEASASTGQQKSITQARWCRRPGSLPRLPPSPPTFLSSIPAAVYPLTLSFTALAATATLSLLLPGSSDPPTPLDLALDRSGHHCSLSFMPDHFTHLRFSFSLTKTSTDRVAQPGWGLKVPFIYCHHLFISLDTQTHRHLCYCV